MKIRARRLWLAWCLAWLSGCASIGPPLPPSLELPKPPTDLHASRKGNKVTLTWSIPERTTDRRRVRYLGKTEICRGLEPVLRACSKPVGESAPPANLPAGEKPPAKKMAESTDTLSENLEREHPDSFATYAIEVLNAAGRGAGLSNQVHVPLVPTLMPFADFAARITAQGVRLTWKCPENASARIPDVTYRFRIYRRPITDEKETRIADLDAAACAIGTESGKGRNLPEAESSFLDQTFEWQKTYSYHGTVVSVIKAPGEPGMEIEGDDTPEVKVFANDVFPPAVPGGLQAVFSGPGQSPFVDLVWTPSTDADLAGYNVYRTEDGQPPIKLNSKLVPAPAFRDMQVQPGRTYFYSVSAVDAHGNESSRSEAASESVP